MPRIKILTDSACDIPLDEAKRSGLCMLPFPITANGRTWLQGENFTTAAEFYSIMDSSRELPKTSQITPMRYLEEYRRLLAEGWGELVVITINSGASSTHQNAILARDALYEDDPAAKRMEIHVVDSRCYSIAYGLPALVSCSMAASGADSAAILKYLHHWFSHIEIYVAAYSLEYAKKSGRIGAAAAVVGGAMGVRPIIKIADGKAETLCKVRGYSAVADKLCDIAQKRIGRGGTYAVLHGTTPEVEKILCRKMANATGNEPLGLYQVGPAVALNIGHEMLGIGVLKD